MNKKTIALFAGGILLGALIMGLGMWLGFSAGVQKAGGQAVATDDDDRDEDDRDADDTDNTGGEGNDTETGDTNLGDTENSEPNDSNQSGNSENNNPSGNDNQPGNGDSNGDANDPNGTGNGNGNSEGKPGSFKVVGYYPSWKSSTEKINYDVLTHINYAFAIPTAEGGLRPLENPHTAQKVINEAHAKGVKVFLAVGGWSYNDNPLENVFMSATETPQKRAAFVDAIMAMCSQYGFDGIDMDWEHPRRDGDSSARYEAVMLELAKRLHAQGKQLTSAVLSGATADGNIYYDAAAHTDKVLAAVDWINVMAYDGGDGERHSAYEFAVNCGNYWHKTRNLPAEKVVLGVPFYARPSWAAYGDILQQVPDAWSKDHTTFNGMDAWYNGKSMIEKKTKFALENLGGIMIWEVTQDATGEHSLQKVIGDTVKKYGN